MSLQESMIAEKSPIIAEEFEATYAALVGATVEGMHAAGRVAQRCSCDWDRCQGWVLGYQPSSTRSALEPIVLHE